MTEADLQLTQMFRATEEPPVDRTFVADVMRQVARERRKMLALRLVLQAVTLIAIVAVAATAPAIFNAFAIADFGGIGRTFTMVVCLVAAGGVVGAPLLARARA